MANKKKIVLSIDRNTDEIECKVGSKTYGADMSDYEKDMVNKTLRSFLTTNTKMTDYEEDCMWMSYRYCIGRKSIASHMHAGEIWKNCRGRMSNDRQLFTAYDINNMIEHQLVFLKPNFHFPSTCESRITYGTAIDVYCEFLSEYGIRSVEDLLKYRSVNVILTDNGHGYKFETTTWKEWIMAHGVQGELYEAWKMDKSSVDREVGEQLEKLTQDMGDPKSYYMHDLEDLFVWNDLCHCFNTECHHKSILTDGSECEWFWSWTNNTEQREDGNYYIAFGYHKIRVPVDKWNGHVTTYIPDESILYRY